MTRLEALVALNMSGEIGSLRFKRLIDYFGCPEDAFKVSGRKFAAICGISEDAAEKVISIPEKEVYKELESVRRSGLDIVTIYDDLYPVNLRNIFDPPPVLYIKGKIRPEDSFAIGVVGSRKASFYGLNQASRFSFDLAGHGFTVVSGLARGIDTWSHEGALKSGGRTIAVIGSGFNYLYPKENTELADQISAKGAVISEFSLNTRPLPQNFPRRNRLISGLSLGVLVVEAGRNSGALITADFALEQGRDVFALPGKIDSPLSFGTNNLIKQGAKLTASFSDITEEFPLALKSRESMTVVEGDVNHEEGEQSEILDLISSHAIGLKDLIERSRMDMPRIYSVLLDLQIQKLIKQLPGQQFVRSN